MFEPNFYAIIYSFERQISFIFENWMLKLAYILFDRIFMTIFPCHVQIQ